MKYPALYVTFNDAHIGDNIDWDARLIRIRSSLDKVNELMRELKPMRDNDHTPKLKVVLGDESGN